MARNLYNCQKYAIAQLLNPYQSANPIEILNDVTRIVDFFVVECLTFFTRFILRCVLVFNHLFRFLCYVFTLLFLIGLVPVAYATARGISNYTLKSVDILYQRKKTTYEKIVVSQQS